jgi:hypothetical protein
MSIAYFLFRLSSNAALARRPREGDKKQRSGSDAFNCGKRLCGAFAVNSTKQAASATERRFWVFDLWRKTRWQAMSLAEQCFSSALPERHRASSIGLCAAARWSTTIANGSDV